MMRASSSCRMGYTPDCAIFRGLQRLGSAVLQQWMPYSASETFSQPHQQQQQSSSSSSTEALHLPTNVVRDMMAAESSRGRSLRTRAVPATRTARAAGFTSLFLQLGYDKAMGKTPRGGLFSLASHERIVETLCRMRGAVLKLGQMLSIQDENTVPPAITAIFARVRDQAFAMPTPQLHATLRAEFGGDEEWRTKLFEEFRDEPIAAASIGQVHYARLRPREAVQGSATQTADAVSSSSSSSLEEAPLVEVAVKVQYPGVAQSIDSDVANLRMLMSWNLLPPGMFVDSILKELRSELSLECQYAVEAEKQMRYRNLIHGDDELKSLFQVPRVVTELSTDRMLITEYVRGVPIDQLAKRQDIPQAFRDRVAHMMMLLTLRELFCWHFMQTDPNYANFLYDAEHQRIHLLDFGAAREYTDAFVSDYLDVVAASARQDRATVIEKSIRLGFLTGHEVKEMIDAHVESVFLLGKPFRDRSQPYDFTSENLPRQIQSHVPTMVRLRLKAPPTPTYSLHRRLSGTILLATRLGASINSAEMFWNIYDDVKRSS